MDINDLKTFLEVNRTRHFGQAAANLFITQSTVSARIRNLERALADKLFIRERNNLQLTPAGEKLVRYAVMITTAWTRAQQEIGISSGGEESLSIGGIPSLWNIFIMQWLEGLSRRESELAINAEILNHDIIQKRIINNSLDVAFVFEPHVHDEVEIFQLDTIPLVMVSSLAGNKLLNQIKGRYLVVDWGSSFAAKHAGILEEMPSPYLHFNSEGIALQYLLDVGGTAYLSYATAQPYLKNKKLFLIKDAPQLDRNLYALVNRNNNKYDYLEGLLAEKNAA